jgi:hypothetical protein
MIVKIQLTGRGCAWQVHRIEITISHQKNSVELNLPASSYDAAVQLAKRRAREMVMWSSGYPAEGLEWDIHPRRLEASLHS